jgi:polysaccharide deacetylase family protein (PEP-CTERM system associated)
MEASQERCGMHHFSVDVEEYFHPTAMSRHFPMATWDSLPRRSPAVVHRILQLLAARGATGTFFVVGWLAARERQMVRAIANDGHEVASHGYEHELVARLGPEAFRWSIRRSKDILEDITGQPCVGYRAPSFSIVPGLEWAFDVLLDEGYAYDASLFPVRQHPTYGYPGIGPDPYVQGPGTLVEVPATTLTVLGARFPASGGAYFRLLPYGLVKGGLKQAEARGAPGTFYIHPWELDDWMPDVPAPRLQRVRTFAGRRRCWTRLERLLSEFRFRRIDQSLASMGLLSRPVQ